METVRYDEVWVANRRGYRKTLTGTRLTKDSLTGYLEPVGRKGFTAEMRDTVVRRFQICSNLAQVVKSVHITIQSIYDAIAVDDKFRDEINKCFEIPNRKTQLNKALKKEINKEKLAVLTGLANKLKNYE